MDDLINNSEKSDFRSFCLYDWNHMLSVPLHSPLLSPAMSSSFSKTLLHQNSSVFGPHCNEFLGMQKRKVLKGILQGVTGIRN